RDGRAWSDMAVLCHDTAVMDACAGALRRLQVPHTVRRRPGDFRPEADTVKILTMRVSKGLEFPLVAIPGLGRLPAPNEDDKDAARLFYVAATRATEQLLVTVSGDGRLGQRLAV
ncbi:MAG: 3'-5' exonuclease, partial [Candidatus Phosphoribacter baldrii]